MTPEVAILLAACAVVVAWPYVRDLLMAGAALLADYLERDEK